MKKILLVRHAKSDWNDFRLSDHDRPLNERGANDAPAMAEFLHKKKLFPDGIYTSTARRARDTALVFAKTLDVSESDFFQLNKLYQPSPETILEVIQEADDKYQTIGIFCHNPGVTYFTNNILNRYIDNIATCGIICMSSDLKTWSEVSKEDLKFEDYFYPKMQIL